MLKGGVLVSTREEIIGRHAGRTWNSLNQTKKRKRQRQRRYCSVSESCLNYLPEEELEYPGRYNLHERVSLSLFHDFQKSLSGLAGGKQMDRISM